MEPATTKTVKTAPLAFAIPKEEKLKPARPVRVRFAPAPTGYLHVGSARTALFNYLFAKKQEGKFVLRLEDTDKTRSKPEFEQDIIESLRWLGIEWDEGPDIGGPYGPYRQSERKAIYRRYLEKLLEEGSAYWCFCSPEDLKVQRQDMLVRGEPPRYAGTCASLAREEVEARRRSKQSAVIRFRMPVEAIRFQDEIRGKVGISGELIGDFIIAKSLTMPLYNFAVAVDDATMEITHVIRGEEHLSNTPKQIVIQGALGFPRVQYAHLPLLLAPDRSKLSKRHGAVSLKEYRDAGYLAEAVVNFLALLGWNPGDDRERFTLDELKKEFSLERVQKAGAIFNLEKLRWLNSLYIRTLPLDILTERMLPFFERARILVRKKRDRFWVPASREEVSHTKLMQGVAIVRERARTLADMSDLLRFLLVKYLSYTKEDLRWKEMEDYELKESLEKGIATAQALPAKAYDDPEALRRALQPIAESFSDRGRLLFPLRVALTGLRESPGLFEVMSFLGKRKTLKRLETAIQKLSPLLLSVLILLFGIASTFSPALAESLQSSPIQTPLTPDYATSFFTPFIETINQIVAPLINPLEQSFSGELERLTSPEYLLEVRGLPELRTITLPSFQFDISTIFDVVPKLARALFNFFGEIFALVSRALIQTGNLF